MESNTFEPDIVPYDEKLRTDWKRKVESWGWKFVRHDGPEYDIYRIEGDCPYCKHYMYREVKIGTGMKFVTGLPTATVKCNCKVAHPPAGIGQGCGQSTELLIL